MEKVRDGKKQEWVETQKTAIVINAMEKKHRMKMSKITMIN